MKRFVSLVFCLELAPEGDPKRARNGAHNESQNETTFLCLDTKNLFRHKKFVCETAQNAVCAIPRPIVQP